MIKSTKTSLKFSNQGKLEELQTLIDEYREVIKSFIDLIWDQGDLKPLLPKETTNQVTTWLSARMVQCAGKQASAIVRGTRAKQARRRFVIDKLIVGGKFKRARKLQRIYDEKSISKPNIDKVNPELDSRFVEIDIDNQTSFDGWITLTSIGRKMKVRVPFKRTKHFNKMLSIGTLKPGIRLGNRSATFVFEIPEPEKKESGTTIGIDIGKVTALSCSNGFSSKPNSHGHDLNSILKVMARKKRGSKGFKRCQTHRTNYVNWSINQLNLQGVRQVNIENIRHLRRGKRSSRVLGHWTYTAIFGKLESYCSGQGVLVHKVSPTYTSQRCSCCGWVRRGNRKEKLFKCDQCGFTLDSDLNASRNLASPLRAISKKPRLRQTNRKGFYWLAEGQECTVPATQKA